MMKKIKQNLLVGKLIKFNVKVTHYHLKGWVDHFPIYKEEDFIALDKIIREIYLKKSNRKKAPSVVHCKGGIGRSCTFISLYYIFKRIKGNLINKRIIKKI